MSNGYIPGDQSLWYGRTKPPNEESQYWYEHIQCCNMEVSLPNMVEGYKHVGLLGYACDEGVRRNYGRVGAKKSPLTIKQRLARMPMHYENVNLYDMGDVICLEHDMEECQQQFANYLEQCLRKNISIIGIGGGHDMAYATYMGLAKYLKYTSRKLIGIINFDAHFDLRCEKQGNSGTPFYQIYQHLNTNDMLFNYLVVGIQRQANTKTLFQTAQNLGVKYITNETVMKASFDTLKIALDEFINQVDGLYVSVDMDVFSSAYAPGVSASSPLGLSPWMVIQCLRHIFASDKVMVCDVAETNPKYDYDDHTVRLAATLIDMMAGWG